MKRWFNPVFLNSMLFFMGAFGARAQNPQWNPAAPIPLDSAFTVGKLENGFTYFIRVNRKPEKRAELRLAVNAGSVLEDNGQQGLAHFAEHMAFNGTEHFKKQDMVNYLESIGMKFGPEVNAYTGFDETVYMLTIPTDSSGIVDRAFQILEDWAHGVSYDSDEIDRERGVVIEEWRLGRGAEARMMDKQFPVLLRESRYAERMVIGQKAVLDTFRYETLRRFYRDWYRPDLSAVVAVGDFEPARIEALIHRHFSHWPVPEKRRIRDVFPVPDHRETLFAIASDPEATGSRISVYTKRPFLPETILSDYRRSILENLYDGMMNERLSELTKTADPPFIYGYSGTGRLLRSKGVYVMAAGVKDNGIETGLDALLTEARRVKQYGFASTELDRKKAEVLRGLEQAYQERDKTESSVYAGEAVDAFLEGDPMPGIAEEYRLNRQMLPSIAVEEINTLAGQTITEQNRVVLVNVPEKEGVRVPTEDALLGVYRKAESKALTVYLDRVSDRPLVEQTPVSGTIARERKIPVLGVTEWILSNGLRVVFKPTDFKNDEILLRAFSPGGNSLVPDSDFISAATAVSVLNEAGLGPFDWVELQKKLADKIAGVTPQISQLSEGFSGSASPKDAETLFQMVYLYFTSPRKDSTAFLGYRSRLKASIENRNARPESAFQDTIQVTLMSHHFRSRPFSIAILEEMNLNASYRIFRDRFADASDFTFFLVGSFEMEKLKPLVMAYLGGLPTLGRKEHWRDVGIRPPEGSIRKTIRRGIEPKSQVALVFSGPYRWNARNNYELDSMLDAVRIRFREVLRENMGGTYGVNVSGSGSRIPVQNFTVTVTFGCSPDREDEMVKAVLLQIDSLKTAGPDESTLQKVKESQIREHETNLKENGFWMNALFRSYYNGEDPERILEYPNSVKKLTAKAIRNAARVYFNPKNMVEVVLLPEGGEKKTGSK